eukprot:COSAG05_NODE_63_length_22889_cov_41.986617_16_plen_136_part_00
MARTRAGSEIVLHTRPVGPVDFTPRDLVYHIACEASIMGTIPQAILRPQAPTHQSKIRARSSPCVHAQSAKRSCMTENYTYRKNCESAHIRILFMHVRDLLISCTLYSCTLSSTLRENTADSGDFEHSLIKDFFA